MFDYKTLPTINFVEDKEGIFSVQNLNNQWILFENETPLTYFGTKSNREYKEQFSAYDLAYGDVLMTGWGLGLAPIWIAKKKGVKTVTVLETSKETVKMWLKNNTLPKNVKILFENANTYKTNEHYDCIFLDHFPDQNLSCWFDEVKQIAENIPNHNVFWFYPLELRYIYNALNLTHNDIYIAPIDFEPLNVWSAWPEFRNRYQVDTIPELTPDKLREYILAFCNRV